MAGFGLVVRFTLLPGHEQAFDDLVAKILVGIHAHEPGTLVYVTHALEGQPGVRVFYELYTDRAAFEEHESQPHTRLFLSERDQHVQSFAVDLLTALDGGTRRA